MFRGKRQKNDTKIKKAPSPVDFSEKQG